ncbi:MAG: BamA/TamA family outer membrane protein [Betaproteobacteria bacterium]
MKNAALLACALTFAAAQALAQAEPAPSFDLQVLAPEPVRSMLEKHMQLQRYRAVTDLDARELEQLLTLARRDIEELLGTLGHFSPRIDLRLSQNPAGQPRIDVQVEPGPATQVRSVDLRVQGAASDLDADKRAELRQRIERGWRLPVGRPFTQDQWDEAKNQALRELVSRHYPRGRISDSSASIDAQQQSADLSLALEPGPLFRLGALQVEGMQRYDPVLVPRLARLKPGQDYDQNQLVQAQQRLVSSGYFSSASIGLDTDSTDPLAAPVQIQVREAPLNKLVLGLGFATDSGPRASIEHINNRVPGLGWRASNQLQLDRKSPQLQTLWTSLPDEASWRWVASARAQRLRDGGLSTDTQTWRFGRKQTGERIDRSLELQYDRSQVSGQGEIGSSNAATGEGSSLSLHHSWTGRFFDSLPFPERGYAFSAEIGGGSTLSGAAQPYARVLGRLTGIVPLGGDGPRSERSRLALRLEAASVQAKASAQVPTTELFRAGGDTSVRGYGLREIGVRLPNGTTAPGRQLLAASVEWQRPLKAPALAGSWEGTLFIDAGQVSERSSELGRDLAVGVGAGALWRSPIGPLQIDLAYGLKVEKLRLHLSVGWVF